MDGGIITPRKETPQGLIRELIRAGAERCFICKGPAVRHGKLTLVLGGEEDFCDKHTFKDHPRYAEAQVTYEDNPESSLVRRAQKWLDENRVEEKT